MSNPIKFKHSFNSGDLVTLLPSVKNLCKKTGRKALIYQRLDFPADYSHSDRHPIITDGRQVCMNEEMFLKLKPLVESQNYIEGLQIWQGESVDFDIDLTRQNSTMPLPGGDIHYWPTLIFPQLEPVLNEPWLCCGFDNKYHNKIIINRTERYQNPYISYHFLKNNESDLLFAGIKIEHELFCNQWQLNIPLIEVDDFNELATAINSCKLFVGNQSFCWHIADGLKVPRILEICYVFPNTFPTGEDGKAFIKQESIEFYFNQMINE